MRASSWYGPTRVSPGPLPNRFRPICSSNAQHAPTLPTGSPRRSQRRRRSSMPTWPSAGDPGGQRALWQYREGHTEAVNAAGVPVKSDIAVPLGQLPGLIEALPGIVEATAPGARMFVWGHLNEGNVHVNIIGALDPAGDGERSPGRRGGRAARRRRTRRHHQLRARHRPGQGQLARAVAHPGRDRRSCAR